MFGIINEGDVDRTVRLMVGLFLLLGVFFGPKSPWCWLGLIPVITALVGFCPLYWLLGVSTCSRAAPRTT